MELGRGGISVGRHDDNAALESGSAIWQGCAGGDGGGDLKGEESFATGMIAVEESDPCEGETFLPEPLDRLERGEEEIVFIDGKGNGKLFVSDLLLCRYFLESSQGMSIGELFDIG